MTIIRGLCFLVNSIFPFLSETIVFIDPSFLEEWSLGDIRKLEEMTANLSLETCMHVLFL